MKQLKDFLTSRGVIIALAMSVLYGIFVFIIYFTGYHAMPKGIDQIPIAIVNQDPGSKPLANQLKSNLPFKHIDRTSSLKDAKSDLNQRKTYLIINIPKDFKHNIKANKSVRINFYVNESAQTSVVTGMKSVAKSVGDSLNQKVIIEKGKAILAKSQVVILQKQIKVAEANMNQKIDQQQAKIASAPVQVQPALAKQLKQKSKEGAAKLKATTKEKNSEIIKGVNKVYKTIPSSVVSKVYRVNKVRTGLNFDLAPFILNLSLYISALLGTLLLYGTYVKFAKLGSRFSSFGMLEIAMGLVAIIGSGVVVGSLLSMMKVDSSQFVQLWINHALEIFAAYNLNSVLVLIMGQTGTALNIFLTMLQVVAGGGMVPVLAMNSFFKTVHYLFFTNVLYNCG